ncbi:MAG TPA: HAMP domain-containing histidine kinase [Hellea balneolensis]|uniref:histidine kinase n=1 Tax=Hellea balneolensis TaxID=287478 RepID=A0A7C3C2M5_9PROT|nr:HAMP domain-containing histidine kinase [Hellea balneolensis]
MFERFFLRRLSAKLLLITVIFVMLAEILIFIPSAAMFRQTWLQDRAQSAGLLTLAIEGVPDYQGGQMLTHQFMADTDVSMVAQKREGMSQLVLGLPPSVDQKVYTVDLRNTRRLPLFRETFRDFFAPDKGYIRILSEPTVTGVEALEVLVPRQALAIALQDYCLRVLLWSLAISLLTGMMIYATLARMIVRPIQTLARDMSKFRSEPRKRAEAHKQSQRLDEIGQLQREFVDMQTGVRHAFKQQERLATVGMAMAKINHDLRNVLTSTQLISDRLAVDKEPRIKTMGERLVRAVDRGVKLCEATLRFSQSVEERPDARPVQLSTLIGEAAGDVMAEIGKVTFKNKVGREIKVMADPDHTYRIFQNLFRNAVEAMKDSSEKVLSVSAEISDDRVCVYVSDTGPGLPKKTQENLFKAFTSASRKGGTGLGLTIARELARAQGGNLQLDSTGAQGTVFHVGLPVAES